MEQYLFGEIFLEGIELVRDGVYCVGSGGKFCIGVLWRVVYVDGVLEKTRD